MMNEKKKWKTENQNLPCSFPALFKIKKSYCLRLHSPPNRLARGQSRSFPKSHRKRNHNTILTLIFIFSFARAHAPTSSLELAASAFFWRQPVLSSMFSGLSTSSALACSASTPSDRPHQHNRPTRFYRDSLQPRDRHTHERSL